MANDRLEPVPVTARERRLHDGGKELRDTLTRAICVAAGKGPKGRDNVICEARNRLAPELWGVISENLELNDRHWIVVTAPGEMFYGFRKLDLASLCAAVHTPERAVLILQTSIVYKLADLWRPHKNYPKHEDLPDQLKAEVAPLYACETTEFHWSAFANTLSAMRRF
ncbi:MULTISPECIES: hypothetical protein [Hansschlegelia]|uniref:Uncharacterized protein n=1 Tax=Hansschlegelia zhihuaiae TaxID=405005 RepID=A0A4Q0MDI4_9HYPH|nr:hypothetical protein [Hansschlegelia zhihuaiae]RXF71458.1 hypothetical protein EK403_15420 [Hansschlegelia zhihuaiae]